MLSCHKLVTRQSMRFDSIQVLLLIPASEFDAAGIDMEMKLQMFKKEVKGIRERDGRNMRKEKIG